MQSLNVPLDKPGPNKRGICLIKVSEARKASYFLASFLTNFLFLFNLIEAIMSISSCIWANPKTKHKTYFFKSSTDMYSSSICLARSMSAASARMQIDIRGRGTLGSLNRSRERMNTKTNNTKRPHALDGSTETLIPLWVVILQTNLELDSFDEVALLFAVGLGQEFLDGAPHTGH